MYFGVPIIRIIYLGYFFGNSHIQAGRVSSLDSQVRNIAVYEKTLSKDLQFLNSPPPPSPPRYFIRVEAKGSNTWQFCSCSRAIQSRSGALWSRFQQTSANVGSLGLRPLRLKLNVSRFLSALLFTRSLVLKGSFVYRSSTAFKLAPNIYLNDSVDAPGPLIT